MWPSLISLTQMLFKTFDNALWRLMRGMGQVCAMPSSKHPQYLL